MVFSIQNETSLSYLGHKKLPSVLWFSFNAIFGILLQKKSATMMLWFSLDLEKPLKSIKKGVLRGDGNEKIL